MKVLVVGCGSIGKKHISNLIRFDNIESILIYSKVKHWIEDLNGKEKIKFLPSFLNDIEVDFAIIANETYKHIDTAILLAEKGIHLFIEKPLSHNLERVDVLEKIVKEKDIKVFIGYNLRFLGAIKYIKEQLFKGVIGDLYFAKIEVGQYLPFWRPHRDYRDSYSARREKGGGVALDLSHELDYMRYLFGDPSCWKVLKTKVSKLEIDSDDVFEGIFKYDNGFICNVHMDYLQIEKKREIRIVGSEGMLICDFIKKNIKIVSDKNGDIFLNDENMFDVNKTYISELSHFIESVKKM